MRVVLVHIVHTLFMSPKFYLLTKQAIQPCKSTALYTGRLFLPPQLLILRSSSGTLTTYDGLICTAHDVKNVRDACLAVCTSPPCTEGCKKSSTLERPKINLSFNPTQELLKRK
jgi:hypothetical protein